MYKKKKKLKQNGMSETMKNPKKKYTEILISEKSVVKGTIKVFEFSK